MYLPPELQYHIISFYPCGDLKPVCKDWNDEIKIIHKYAANTIGNLYIKVSENYTTIEEMVRYYVVHYPNEFFIVHPEFAVKKLDLNEDLLSILPPPEDRKRSDVRNWMLNMPISVDDWNFVGW